MEEFDIDMETEEPKAPKARTINKNKLPKKARNLSKEQLLKAFKKKKECDNKALSVVEKLLEPIASEKEFLDQLKEINQSHFDDIVEERHILNLCGYPLCAEKLKEIPKQKYIISPKVNKVFDITERKKFCSNACFKAANYIKDQMLTSPLWLRDQEEIPEFKLLSHQEEIPQFKLLSLD